MSENDYLAFAFIGVLALFAFAIYFLPLTCAWLNRHPNVEAIAILNVFLGWTFIGWVVALVWAFTQQRSRD